MPTQRSRGGLAPPEPAAAVKASPCARSRPKPYEPEARSNGPKERGTRTPAAQAAAKPVQTEIIVDGEPTAIAEYISRAQGHLTRMRRADDMLDAYAMPRNASGIQPSAELAKARATRAKAVEGVISTMDELVSFRTAHKELEYDEEGIDAEEIFCSACHGYESVPSNDIILCDTCNHSYHQRCIQPPISDEALEDDESDWFCPVCVAVATLLDAVNEYSGKDWPDVHSMFPKERRGPDAESSEDEEDDDYVASKSDSEPGDDSDGDKPEGGGSDDEDGEGGGEDGEEEEEAPLGVRSRRVDYAALAQELFGEDEDEDADPAADGDFDPRRAGAGGAKGGAKAGGRGTAKKAAVLLKRVQPTAVALPAKKGGARAATARQPREAAASASTSPPARRPAKPTRETAAAAAVAESPSPSPRRASRAKSAASRPASKRAGASPPPQSSPAAKRARQGAAAPDAASAAAAPAPKQARSPGRPATARTR
ncbi:hypothetical protein T492DRAFT_1055644 [Pavlovales sp. CCMP2436]|nr:hypothetical protein T492DRAFT_1055644 [Pavlovales sp. CCMP2436]